jgi:hypothetical protein
MEKHEVGRLYGFHRAKVVDNQDAEDYGRVLVWIPDLMTFIPDTAGIWARPANNPVGGRNIEDASDNNFMGTSYIPRKGSWVWVFFEAGNINRPYYFAALDLENAKVLPEVRVGSNTDKWVIFKSHDGRTIVISDDPNDARVEVTGKKRKLTSPPSGDTGSVYTIDENQTTILLDEREGKEKVLIRTRKGDFLHLDIDEQELHAKFAKDIHIKSDGNIYLTAQEELHLKGKLGKVYLSSDADDVNIKSGGKINEQSGDDHNINTGSNSNIQAAQDANTKSGGDINHDANNINDLGGAAGPAEPATAATDANPKGERNT